MGVDLRYEAPSDVADCLTRDAFERELVDRLATGLAIELSPGASLGVTTQIVREGDTLRATVALAEEGFADVAQQLVASISECRTLGTAAALAASMAVERATEERDVRRQAPVVEDGRRERLVEPKVPAPRRPPERPTSDATSRPHIATHGAAVVGFGILPAPSAGAVVGGSIDTGAWRTGLELGTFLPAEAASPRGGGARAALVFVAATPCRLAGRFVGCAVASIGDLNAAGTGPLLSRASRTLYAAVGLRVGVELARAAPFSFWLHGGVLTPLIRTELRIGDEVLWKTPAAAAELALTWRVTIL